MVYYSALRQLGGDSHLAKDVAQTVFVLLSEKAASLLRHPSLAGWLYATVHFKVCKALEAERRRRVREEAAATMQMTLAESTEETNWEQIRPILDEAILTLTTRDREALVLRYFEGRSFSDIGSQLSLTEKVAQKRVERAVDKLRGRFAGRGITSSSAALAVLLGSQAGLAAPGELAACVISAAMPSAGSVTSLSTTIAVATHMPAGIASFVGISAVVGLLSIGIAIYEYRDFFHTQTFLKSASEQYEAKQDELRTLGRNSQIADSNLAALRQELAQVRSADAARAASAAKAHAEASIAQARADWELFRLAHPEAPGMLAMVDKAQIERNFGLFFQRAGLTASQIQEFEKRTVELFSQNEAIAPGSLQHTVAQLPDDQLRAILGEQAFQLFQNYNRSMPANMVASYVQSSASVAGAPISSDQEEGLAQIVADCSPSYRNGHAIDPVSLDWENAEARAQALLTPYQWQAAEGVFLNLQYQVELAQAQQTGDLGSTADAKN
jgi:RNA polymerase sigma factor (sigma-70 family)